MGAMFCAIRAEIGSNRSFPCVWVHTIYAVVVEGEGRAISTADGYQPHDVLDGDAAL